MFQNGEVLKGYLRSHNQLVKWSVINTRAVMLIPVLSVLLASQDWVTQWSCILGDFLLTKEMSYICTHGKNRADVTLI